MSAPVIDEFQLRPATVERTGDNSPASSLYGYVWRMSALHQIWVALLGALVAALAFVPLELQRRVIDVAIPSGVVGDLLWLGAVFVVFVIVHAMMKFALRMSQGWLSESAVRYTRRHLAQMYASERNSTADSADHAADADGVGFGGPGKAVSVIGAEVDKLGNFVGEAIVSPVINVGTVIALFTYMLVVEPFVALISALFLVPQIVVTPLLQRHINRLTERRVTLVRKLGDLVSAQNDASELPDGQPFTSNLSSIFDNRMRIYAWKFLLKGLINISNHLATLCVLLLGGWLALKGETTIGVVVAFIAGFERVSDPMRRLLGFYRTAQLAAVQHRMIAAILLANRKSSPGEA